MAKGPEQRLKKRPEKGPEKSSVVRSFAPIAAPDARVLVLGTAPSVMSLARQQYYGHPRNAFWAIMGELFDAGRELDYELRTGRLTARGIAVWDVLKRCEREGSLDSAICRESEEANDLVQFLDAHRAIHTIFFNGTKAETAFRQHLRGKVEKLARRLRYVRLPSTSPAHAGRTVAEKLEAWREVARAIEA